MSRIRVCIANIDMLYSPFVLMRVCVCERPYVCAWDDSLISLHEVRDRPKNPLSLIFQNMIIALSENQKQVAEPWIYVTEWKLWKLHHSQPLIPVVIETLIADSSQTRIWDELIIIIIIIVIITNIIIIKTYFYCTLSNALVKSTLQFNTKYTS